MTGTKKKSNFGKNGIVSPFKLIVERGSGLICLKETGAFSFGLEK